MFRLVGLRHHQHHLARTAITIIGVALGVAMLVAVHALNRSIVRSFEDMVERIGGRVDLVVGGVGAGLDDELLPRVLAVPGVAHAAPVIEKVITLPELPERLLVLGVDLLEDPYFLRADGADTNAEGALAEPLAFLNSTDNILLARRFAEQHHLKVGDSVIASTVRGRVPLTVYGRLDDQGAADAFGGAVGLMGLDAAQLLFGMEGRYSRIDVALAPGVAVDEGARRIRDALGGGVNVRPPRQLGDMAAEMTGVFRRGMLMSSFVALLVGLCIIFNTLLVSLRQRQRELGILRALGATAGMLRRLVLGEALAMGLVGGLLGCALGLTLARLSLRAAAEGLSSAYLSIRPGDVSPDPTVFLVGMTVGLATSVLAAWGPATRAARQSPIATIRDVTTPADEPRHGRRIALAGFLFVVGALLLLLPVPADALVALAAVSSSTVFLATWLLTPTALVAAHRLLLPTTSLLGVGARLAVDNMRRTVARGSANVAALAAAVLTIVAIGSYIDSFMGTLRAWMERTVVSDIIVGAGPPLTGQEGTPVAPELADKIAAVPGVAYAYPFRIVFQDYRGSGIQLLVAPMDAMLRRTDPTVIKGDPITPQALQDPAHPRVLISESMAALHGLGPGDTLALETADGARDFTVHAVIVDYSSNLGLVYLDRGFFLAHWHDPLANLIEVFLVRPDDAPQVRAEILRRWGDALDLHAFTNTEYRANIDDLVGRFFALTRLLVLVALFVAVLGILNTMQAAVLDRTREIGVLRAVGTTRGQLTRMIVLEAVVMALVAVVLGSLGGVVTGALMIRALMQAQTGWSLPFVMPWGVLGMLVVVCAVMAAIAGWLPARRAARLPVVAALSYE